MFIRNYIEEIDESLEGPLTIRKYPLDKVTERVVDLIEI